jgi:sugar O-acyltransferase (sialic acid O-acetyltransferase NeuD family)
MKLLLWGAGGHAKVVLDVATATGAVKEIAFIDDTPRLDDNYRGYPLLGTSMVLRDVVAAGYSHFIVCIGDNWVRSQCYEKAVDAGLTPATLIHPSAVVSPSARVGVGTVIKCRAVVDADVIVGDDSIIDAGVALSHDSKIGNHVHISPGASLGGEVKISAYAFLGVGAVVLPRLVVGEHATVGAGAVVVSSVASGDIVAGVPARPVRSRVPA